jgi:hypothetical protein
MARLCQSAGNFAASSAVWRLLLLIGRRRRIVILRLGPLDGHRIPLIKPARQVNAFAARAAKRQRVGMLRVERLIANRTAAERHG